MWLKLLKDKCGELQFSRFVSFYTQSYQNLNFFNQLLSKDADSFFVENLTVAASMDQLMEEHESSHGPENG